MEPPAKPPASASLQAPAMPTPAKPAAAAGPSDAPSESETGEATPAVKKKRRSNWKLILIVSGGVLLILALVASAIGPNRGQRGGPKVTPIVPTPTTPPRPTIPQLPLGEPSVYSNDPQILQLEGSLKTFERQLDSIDYREQDLDPPVLDMKVEFKLTPTPKPK